MADPVFNSLYSVIAGEVPYFSASIVLCTSTIEPGRKYTLNDLGEPSNPGYQRITFATIAELFPNPIIKAGESARLTSRQLDYVNRGTTPVSITGVALVVHKDRFTPVVMVVVPSEALWQPDKSLGGKMLITSQVYDGGE